MSADSARLARGVVALGFEGTDPAVAPTAFDAGAYLLFARNVVDAAQLRALTAALRGTGEPPPLVAVDQEGGRVARIADGVSPIPSAMALGALGDAETVGALAARLGGELRALGVSLDLAPVADLALAPESTVIGTRAFGDDPRAVAACVAAFASGLERSGVAAALKHFPGHGATALDSHAALPRIDAPLAALRGRDLVPFAAAIAAGAASVVMTAHVVVEALDPVFPASLSPAAIALLRDELGFDGVVMTDCLEMEAIAATVGTARGAVLALIAGADLVTISHRRDRAEDAVAAIVAAVASGELPRARLEAAHARVGALRARRAPDAAPAESPDPRAVAAAAITIVRGDPVLRGDAVTVVSFEGTLGDAAARSGGAARDASSLSAALRRRGLRSEHFRVALDPEPDDVALLLAHLARQGDREVVAVARRADLHPAQRDAVAAIVEARPGTLVVAAREPFDAALWPQARRVVCTYGDEPLAIDACADVLAGRARPRGRLPVRLDAAAAR